jgi:acetyl-CoA acetyltransferase family protein
MPETAENVVAEFAISREDQDAFAFRSQTRAAAAQASGRFAKEIVPVKIPQRKGDPIIVDKDEHPRLTSLDKLAALPAPFRKGGTVTAGNASGVNDGAAALLIASKAACDRYDLTPLARIVSVATAGVDPRIMGIGPVPATRKLLERHGLAIKDIDLIELNEAFAAQALACMRQLGVADNASRSPPRLKCATRTSSVQSAPCASASARALQCCSKPCDGSGACRRRSHRTRCPRAIS